MRNPESQRGELIGSREAKCWSLDWGVQDWEIHQMLKKANRGKDYSRVKDSEKALPSWPDILTLLSLILRVPQDSTCNLWATSFEFDENRSMKWMLNKIQWVIHAVVPQSLV